MTAESKTVSEIFSERELAFFEENGFVVARCLLDEATRTAMLERTRRDLEQLIEPIEYEAELNYPGAPESFSAEGGKTARRLKLAHARDPIFLETLQRPELRKRLEQLLGPQVVMPTAHHNCIMTKQPRFSSDTGWHQDIRYWKFARRELITVWIALGKEHRENGCLKVIPGTHRHLFSVDQLDDELFLRSDLPENQEWIEKAQYVPLEAGDVLFFHCRTFHAASRNYAEETKYSAVFTFRAADNPPDPDSRSASLPEIELNSLKE